jgi:hypothetical protein
MSLPLELIGRRDNDPRRSRLGDVICRLASTSVGEIIATVLAPQRLLEAHGVDIHALVEHLENGSGGLSDAIKAKVRAKVERAFNEGYAGGVKAAEAKQHGTGAYRWDARMERGRAVRAASEASAARATSRVHR